MKRLLALIFATISSLLFWNSCSQKEQVIPVAFVTLSQPAAEMIIGEFITLKATISPSNATEREIMWASSKQSVASVDQTGKVVAIAEGTSTITATAGGKLGSCVVTVSKGVVEVSSINFDKTGVSLKVGETVTLTATVKPDDATDKTVTWSTSNASVATVSDGVVTAIKLGSATIRAKAGDKEATCAITVEATPVTSVTLDQTSASLKVGETVTLTATVKPDDATDKTVTWSTSNASVATVSDGVVTAIKLGSATIRAKAGDKSATCSITVETTPVTSVTLNQTSASLKVGETVTLTATVKPDDATDKTVTWSTSDASVATVDNGVVTAKKVGSATITAKAGDKSATCAITVVATPVTSVTLDRTSASLKAGETVTLTATVKPDDATDKTVTWSTSDNSVVTVNSSGLITALSKGNATITATANDGSGVSGSCDIEVKQYVTSISLSQTGISCIPGSKTQLSTNILPDNADDRTVEWTSSNSTVATVDSNGLVTAIGVGNATISVKAKDGSGVESNCVISIWKAPEAVDLGLSVKWASWNLGASSSSEGGDYFAWGEVLGSGDGKSNFDFYSYKWYEGQKTGTPGLEPELIPKYNYDPIYGPVDNLDVLEPEDDAASIKLGGSWRMPTQEEFAELRSKCNWVWTTENGIAGMRITSKVSGYTDKSIFLPGSGTIVNTTYQSVGEHGSYWSSNIDHFTSYHSPNGAMCIHFGASYYFLQASNRSCGFTVRAVTK